MYSENSKKFIRLDSFSKQILEYLGNFSTYIIFETTALLNLTITVFPSGSFCQAL